MRFELFEEECEADHSILSFYEMIMNRKKLYTVEIDACYEMIVNR